MTQLSRRTFLEIASLASAGLLGGCSGGTNRIIRCRRTSRYLFSPTCIFSHLSIHFAGKWLLSEPCNREG